MTTMTRSLLTTAAALLAGTLLLAQPAVAQQTRDASGASEDQTISVLGEGSASANPGRARLTLGVEVANASLAAAQDEANRRMTDVVARLRSAGIAESELQTVSYVVSPDYDAAGGPAQTLRGYLVQHLVEAQVRDVVRVGDVVDQATSAGANRVSGVIFEAQETDALEQRAREEALQDARATAEHLARRLNVTLGDIQVVEELSGPGVPEPVNTRAPIQPGNVEVRSALRVVWSIR
jgi:uncharacterized protein YggE